MLCTKEKHCFIWKRGTSRKKRKKFRLKKGFRVLVVNVSFRANLSPVC